MDTTKCINFKIYRYHENGEMEDNPVITNIPCKTLTDPNFSTTSFDDVSFDNLISNNFNDNDFIFKPSYYKIKPNTSDKFNVREQQRFIGRYATFLNNFGNGVLVYHGIGSGKTCAGIIAGEAYAYMQPDPKELRPNDRRIVLITPAQIQEQFKAEIQGKSKKGCVYSLSPDITYEEPKIIASASSRAKKLEGNEKSKIFDAKWQFFTHVGFRNQIEKAYSEGYPPDSIYNVLKTQKNCLIIIDEAQNLTSEVQDDKGKIYSTYIHFFMEIAKQNHRIVLLSGTPIRDNPFQFGLLMNLLNPRLYFPTSRKDFESLFVRTNPASHKPEPMINNANLFKWMIKGYVSYFKGGNPLYYPKKTIEYVYATMNNAQLTQYENFARQQDELEQKQNRRREDNEEDDVNFLGFLVKGQIMCTTASKEIMKDIKMEDGNISDGSLYEIKTRYSEKIANVIQLAHMENGKVFIYTDFLSNGAHLLAGLFESMGYKSIKCSSDINLIPNLKSYIDAYEELKTLEELNDSEKIQEKIQKKMKKLKQTIDTLRPMVCKNRVASWTGGKELSERKNYNTVFMDVFNSKANDDGSIIKIIIGTKAIREGISFKEVKAVHILNPWWNQSVIEQVMGRAVRFGSHKGDAPEVHIYRHVTVFPKFYNKEGESDYQFEYNVKLTVDDSAPKKPKDIIYKGRHSRLTADQIIEKKSLFKQNIIRQFEKEIKQSAVDCRLNKFGNLVRLTKIIDTNVKSRIEFEYYLDESDGKTYELKPPNLVEVKYTVADIGNVKRENIKGRVLTIDPTLTEDNITEEMIKLEDIGCESLGREKYDFNKEIRKLQANSAKEERTAKDIIDGLVNYTSNVNSVGEHVIQAFFNTFGIRNNIRLANITHCLINAVKSDTGKYFDKFKVSKKDDIDPVVYKRLGELGYPIGKCKIVIDKISKKKDLDGEEKTLYTVISYMVREHNENVQRFSLENVESDLIKMVEEEAEFQNDE